MQVSVETTQGLERRISITVPAAAISTEVEKELRQIAKNRRIDGFRPGKAPVAMIKKMFGLSVLQDVASRQMQNHFYQAIISNKLQPAGAPTFAPGQLAEGQDLQFTATFEVYPEITLDGLSNVEVTKPTVEITADDMAKMIETLRKQHASWGAKDGAAASGDRVKIDFVGSVEGEEFEGGKAEGFSLDLGQGRMIPGFEDGIIGKAVGETFTADVTFPAEYHAENLKGKAAQFVITVQSVEAQVLPEVNEEFVKLFGLTENTVEALHAEVRKNMERELNQALKGKVKEQVIKGLLANHEVDVPQALIESEVDVLRRQALQRFGNNVDAKNLPELPAALFADQARDRVKVGLLLGEVIKSNNLQVDDSRVQSLIATVASAYEDPAEVVQYYNSNKELLQGMRNLALEEQAIDLVLAQAKVTEQAAKFDEIMNPQAAN